MNFELVTSLETIAEKIKPLDVYENFLQIFLDERNNEGEEQVTLQGVRHFHYKNIK